MRLTGPRAFVDCLQPHLGHQSPDTVPPDGHAFAAQIGCDLAQPEERVLGEDAVDLFHHRQSVRVDPDRRVVKRQPAEPDQLALPADA